jgi:YidC/Oxa1 family membrane protein insertase
VDRNLLLAFALSFAVLVFWSMIQEPPERPQSPGGKEAAEPQELAEPTAEPVSPLPPPLPGVPAAPVPAPEAELAQEETILQIDRAEYRAELTTLGAGLRHWMLKDYDDGGDEPSPIVLTTGQAPYAIALVTPFDELGFGDLGRAVWDIEASDPNQVVFGLTLNGVNLRKSYTFEDSYTFRLRIDVENRSDAEIAPRFALIWPAHSAEGNDFREQALVLLHQGSLEQQALAGLGKGGFFGAMFGRRPPPFYDFTGDIDWAGVHTTYFLSALLPDDPVSARVRLAPITPGVAGATQIFFDPVRVPPGLDVSREFTAYAGPKQPARLEAVGGETIRAIDLGWSWVAPLTRFFGWMLHQIYGVIPNFGVAIIVLTVLVRVVTTPLTMRQMRSMERMRALQPRLKGIQEKYADDRQRQSEEMMRMYRQEKVNPLGGCLPMLLQLPVFIGLFYALRGSIQLRQAPFVGWIDDLSAPEQLFVIPGLDLPLRVLPLIMGATMVLQQRITPMQMDPAQARMMMTIMPIMMTVIFYQFASGLVLYWMVSNVLAIGHQLWVGRRMRTGGAKT